MKVKVEIPIQIKSANAVGPYTHWRVYYNYKKMLGDALGFALPRVGQPPKRKVKVVITSRRFRKLDYDNYVQGCKPVLDTLKKRGYLVDDSPEHVEVTYLQEIITRKEQPLTIISIQS